MEDGSRGTRRFQGKRLADKLLDLCEVASGETDPLYFSNLKLLDTIWMEVLKNDLPIMNVHVG